MNDPRAPGLAASADDVAARVAATIRPEIRALTAYPVAKAVGMIKLDAMENPYSLPADVRTRLANALSEIAINRYPDGGADVVKAALRASLALPDDVALMVGNGSDELLQIITTAVAKPGAAIVAPDPSFVMYRLYAVYANARYVAVPLQDNFDLDGDAMLAAIERERPALIWLAYPNNPTGNLFDAATVERIIRAAPGLVVVDEAYYAFADRSFLPCVREFANLIVVRTADPQMGQTAPFVKGLYDGVADAGVPAVGVARSSSDFSARTVFQQSQLSTVDDIDLAAGKLALAIVLSQPASRADYGLKTRDLLPLVTPVPTPSG